MAFITKKEVSEKRKAVKAAFPSKDGWKFSITGGNSSKFVLKIMQYPKEFNFGKSKDINHYWYRDETNIIAAGYSEKELKVIDKLVEIAFDGHWDKSDSMTDYFNCSYYVTIGIGKWNKDAVSV